MQANTQKISGILPILLVSIFIVGCQNTLLIRPNQNDNKQINQRSEQESVSILPTPEQVRAVSELVNQPQIDDSLKPVIAQANESIASFLLATSCHRSVSDEPAAIAQKVISINAKGDFSGILTGVGRESNHKCATVIAIKDWKKTEDYLHFVVAYQLPESNFMTKRHYKMQLQPDGRWLFVRCF